MSSPPPEEIKMKLPDISALNFKDTSTMNANLDLDDSSHFNLDDLLISQRGDKERKAIEKEFIPSCNKLGQTGISGKFFEVSDLLDNVKAPEELDVPQILDGLSQVIVKVRGLKDKRSLNNRQNNNQKLFGGFKENLNELSRLKSG